MDESGTNGVEYKRKVPSGRRVVGAIRLMLWICSFSVLESGMRHCLCLFLDDAMERGGEILSEDYIDGELQRIAG